jgi:predicted TIM-barrel fold metal-dependent hydrolase
MPTDRARPAASQAVSSALLAAGVLALVGGTMATPELAARFSPDGILSLQSLWRLNALRVLAMAVGSVAVICASWWRWRRLSITLVVLAGSLWWSAAIVSRVYPNHLLLQPARLMRVALGEELLLSDYDPKPKLALPAHEVTRARYPAINIHAHFRRWIKTWTPEELIAVMDACNVRHLVDLDGGLGEELRQEIERYARPYPDRFTIFATFRFDGGKLDWEDFQKRIAMLGEAKAMGAKGLKIWKNLGLRTRDEHNRLIAVDDPRLDPLWAKAGELGLPILIHVGDPAAFFDPIDKHNERYEELKGHSTWSFYGPQYPSLAEIEAQFERVLERHREVPFIYAHLGNRTDDLQAAGGLLDRHPNLYMDISARVSEVGRQPRTASEFFIRYQDRLLFATDGNPGAEVYRAHFRFLETADEYFDYPLRELFNFGRWKIYGIDLPDEVLRKLYHDNAARLLGLPSLPAEGDQG